MPPCSGNRVVVRRPRTFITGAAYVAGDDDRSSDLLEPRAVLPGAGLDVPVRQHDPRVTDGGQVEPQREESVVANALEAEAWLEGSAAARA